jgi:cell division topological specificity factor
MLELIQRLFLREGSASKDVAKERLRMVLVHDRATVAPHVWEALKVDLIRVISRYLDIDEASMDVQLQTEKDAVALVASIPVRRVKRGPLPGGGEALGPGVGAAP